MQKIYLLLRNNKQSGPFTKEELLQLTLQKHDLIWVEGKSAGWRNPEEINELKTVEMQPATEAVAKPKESPKETPAVVQKAPAKHIYIRLPSGMPAAVAAAPITTETPGIPEPENAGETTESFDERVARMQQRIAAYNSSQPKEKEKETVDTKYARSLDDIKDEYASWLHRQKRKKTSIPVKPVLMAAATLFAIALISFLILRKAPADATVLQQQQPMPLQMVAGANEPAVSKTPITAAQEKERSYQPVAKKQAPARRKEPVVKKSSTAKKTTLNQSSASAPLVTRTEKKEPESTVPLTQLIRIYSSETADTKGKGVSDMKITVQNNSRQVLKVVAVDVLYYGSTGKQLQKKTIYFSNLQPNRSLTLSAPGHNSATAVDYKLGLISSEQGLFYAKQ